MAFGGVDLSSLGGFNNLDLTPSGPSDSGGDFTFTSNAQSPFGDISNLPNFSGLDLNSSIISPPPDISGLASSPSAFAPWLGSMYDAWAGGGAQTEPSVVSQNSFPYVPVPSYKPSLLQRLFGNGALSAGSGGGGSSSVLQRQTAQSQYVQRDSSTIPYPVQVPGAATGSSGMSDWTMLLLLIAAGVLVVALTTHHGGSARTR